jgi:DNA invertase Pin-like site-specific DNA recombinase
MRRAPKRRALGYVRVSTQKQAEEGYGLDVQASAVHGWAKANGARLVAVIRDEGANGSLEDRPGLAKLLTQLEPGMVVVVARLDRLARDLMTQEILLRDIRRRGADVVSCSQAEADYLTDDPNDPTRKLIRQVLGAVSEFERALIRLRLSRGRAAKAAQGGFAYGSPPFGYRAVSGELVKDRKEQVAIVLARRLRKRGLSLRQIAKELNAKGHKPRRGGIWHPGSVTRIVEGR